MRHARKKINHPMNALNWGHVPMIARVLNRQSCEMVTSSTLFVSFAPFCGQLLAFQHFRFSLRAPSSRVTLRYLIGPDQSRLTPLGRSAVSL